jgi:anti-sigma factor RsiW
MAYWRDRIQDYLDDRLPKREAVAFFLYAQQHPELQAELELYRRVTAALEAAPREEPSAGFDTAVLAKVPLDHYRHAPRLPRPVLVLGDLAPSAVLRAVRSLRRGAGAAAAAYVLALIVSHSFLAESASRASQALEAGLSTLADRAQGIPVLSGIVGSVAWLYDAGVDLVSAVGVAVGAGTLTVFLGILLGVSTWALIYGARRRSRGLEA